MPQQPASCPRPALHPALLFAGAVLLVLAIGGWLLLPYMAMAPSALPPSLAVQEDGAHTRLTTDTPTTLRLSAAGPEWKDISAAQRQILEPLHLQWPTMGALTKRRWLVLAERYPSMSEKEQTKLHARMQAWASFSAQQRNQARLNFSNARSLTTQELRAKWEEYLALSEAEKQRLAQEAEKALEAQKIKQRRRKLARVPVPASAVAPGAALPPPTPALAAPATPQATPVATPQAIPVQELPLLQEAAPSPVQVPQQMYTMELPPLPLQPLPAEPQQEPTLERVPEPLPEQLPSSLEPSGTSDSSDSGDALAPTAPG